jgi:hypothetical protein
MYVKAAATLTAGNLCRLSLVSGLPAYRVIETWTKTLAAAALTAQNMLVASVVPCADLVSGEYGWAFVSGLIQVNAAVSCAALVRVGLTSTAGRIDDADVDYEVKGAYLPVAQGGTAGVLDLYSPQDLYIVRNAA